MKPTMRPTLALALLLMLSSVSQAASPRMRSVRPPGGRRGTEVEVTIAGRRMYDAQEIVFYHPGITTTGLKAVSDNEIKATLSIAADSPLGLHDFRIRAASGLSEVRSFSVGTLPEVAEVEPNSDFARPQPIALDTTVNGVADNEDDDYYVVEAKKGERISAEVEGIRLGTTFFDPYVAIFDRKRFELAVSDDASIAWQDGFASVVAPADGPYIIQVRESAYAGNANCLYRLHVGHFPRPTAIVPLGGKLGETVEVRWIGDVLGETRSTVSLPDRPVIDFGLTARDDRGIAPYPNLFRLTPFGNVIESEPNDIAAAATRFSPPLAVNGVIDHAGDKDHFVFHANKGDRYEVKVYARALRSPLDAVLAISTPQGSSVGRNDDANGSPDSLLPFNASNDGDYVISIQDHLLKGGPDYTYRIEVAPTEPKLTLSVPNESVAVQRQNQAVAVSLPRGGRQAILVNASRAGFGGELAIDADGLPAGVTAEIGPMAASLSTYPVLFSASSDAPLGAALATFKGKPTDPNVNVPSVFQHAIEMVVGQNNVPFWTRTEDRFAMAVTEEAPFSIEVIEPKVPIVRSGTMNWKVVAHRKPEFKAPINVALVWNPPGIGSSGSINIPEGQDEALIPLNASDAAELKTWRTVVHGTAEVPNNAPAEARPTPPANPNGNGNGRNGQFRHGTITVASQMVKLTIAEKYFNFEFQPATVEQGKETDLIVKVTRLADFEGEARVTLLGLPNKVTAEPKSITKETTELVFHVATDKTSPAGNHNTLVGQAVLERDGEPIVHNLGSGKLRIDVPLPPKANAAASQDKPPAGVKPAEKPLTRLEQLRRERQESSPAGPADKK
jgi:hypothetical protein